MSPEGRNVKDSYSLSLEVAAILGLAVIHREFQRHLYPAAHLQLQLLRSLGKVTHRLSLIPQKPQQCRGFTLFFSRLHLRVTRLSVNCFH